jgi:hypothetical protein
MSYKNWILIGCFCLSNVVFAQRKLEQIDPEKKEEQQKEEQQKQASKASRPKWFDKVSFGGNVGGTISNLGSFFTVQPMAFYRFSDVTLAGAGATYYYWSRDFQTTQGKVSFSDNAYGLNLFARQLLFDPAFVHAEYMPLNFSVYDVNTRDSRREWVSAFYLGGGVNQSISDRSSIYIMILYDVLHDPNKSFRASPLDFRTGFYF